MIKPADLDRIADRAIAEGRPRQGEAWSHKAAELRGATLPGGGFVTLEKWLGAHELLILKRNNALPMVVLPWATWARIVRREAAI